MAVERETISNISFGIEDTLDTGSREVLSALYDDPLAKKTPDQIKNIDDEDEEDDEEEVEGKQPQKAKVKKVEKQIKSQKPKNSEDEEDFNGNIDFSKVLEESLISEDDEEEGEDQEEEVDTSKEGTEVPTKEVTEEEPIWVSLSRDLTKLGIFTPDEDEDGNIIDPVTNGPEEFKDRFISEIKKGVNNTVNSFLARFGDDYKDAFNAIYVNGVNPKDYFATKVEIDNLKDLDLTKEANQEYVIRKTLENQGFEDQEVEEELQRLKDYGDLETVANRHHKVLAKKEEQRLKQIADEKAKQIENQQRIKSEYDESVYKILSEKFKTKDFDGIPVNKQIAEKTMDFLTTEKYKLPSGELLTEWDKEMLELKRPENYGMKVKLALLYQLLKTDPQLTSLKKRAVSNESNSIFNEIARHKTRKAGNSSSPVVKASRQFID